MASLWIAKCCHVWLQKTVFFFVCLFNYKHVATVILFVLQQQLHQVRLKYVSAVFWVTMVTDTQMDTGQNMACSARDSGRKDDKRRTRHKEMPANAAADEIRPRKLVTRPSHDLPATSLSSSNSGAAKITYGEVCLSVVFPLIQTPAPPAPAVCR